MKKTFKSKCAVLILVSFSLVSAWATTGTELQDSYPLKSLRKGHEFSILRPALVMAGSKESRDKGIEVSYVNFQGGLVSCELKIEGNFLNDELLDPRILPITIEAKITEHKDGSTQFTWKFENPLMSELSCLFPENAKLTVGEIKKAFKGISQIEVQESENYERIILEEESI